MGCLDLQAVNYNPSAQGQGQGDSFVECYYHWEEWKWHVRCSNDADCEHLHSQVQGARCVKKNTEDPCEDNDPGRRLFGMAPNGDEPPPSSSLLCHCARPPSEPRTTTTTTAEPW